MLSIQKLTINNPFEIDMTNNIRAYPTFHQCTQIDLKRMELEKIQSLSQTEILTPTLIKIN